MSPNFYGTSRQEMKRQAPCYCPGVPLIQVFLGGREKRDVTVLPLAGVGPLRFLFNKVVAYGICAVFISALICDVLDLVSGGNYRESPFGKSNPLISFISFAASQVGFFMASASAVFLVSHARQIIYCADVLNNLVDTLQLDAARLKSRIAVIPQLLLLRMYFYLVLVLGLVRFGMTFQPTFTDFWTEGKYAMIALPQGFISLYAHSTMFLSILFYYPVNMLFCYLASILVGCTKTFYEDNCLFLQDMTNAKDGLSSDTFVCRLRDLRSRHERINNAFDVMDETFSLKMLVDILGNIGVVLCAIAWFSVWTADPSQQSTVGFARHVLAAGIYLLTVWVVGNQPIALLMQHRESLELMEKIIYRRHVTMIDKPTRMECGLIEASLDRFKSKVLFFVPGGVLELSPFLLGTILAGIVGFAGFVMDRAENYRNLIESTNPLASLNETHGHAVELLC